MDRQSSMQYLEVVVSECCGICLVMSGKGIKMHFFMEEYGGLEKALVAVERMKKYLCQGKNYHIPLAFYEENLYSCQEIREAISRQIRGGQVCDGASRTLKSCRQDIEKEERAMREKADRKSTRLNSSHSSISRMPSSA